MCKVFFLCTLIKLVLAETKYLINKLKKSDTDDLVTFFNDVHPLKVCDSII